MRLTLIRIFLHDSEMGAIDQIERLAQRCGQIQHTSETAACLTLCVTSPVPTRVKKENKIFSCLEIKFNSKLLKDK